MARATIERETPQPVLPPIKSVTLVLSGAEAQTLANILALVGGSGQLRRYNSSMLEALLSVGVVNQSDLRNKHGWKGGITVPEAF